MSDVIAAVATGLAPCAIGILRLSGAGCIETAARVFRPTRGGSLCDVPDRRLVRGSLFDPQGRCIDEALAVCARAPHSYTGEDTVELQCHGSPAVLSAGLLALCAAGARQAGPGEFTKRAFLNGKLDLTAAEAVVDLIEAETADAAANAAAQVGGALRRRLDPVYDALTAICSHFHAVLDYPDEDIPAFRLADFRATLADAAATLRALAATCDRGRILKQGLRVALLGRPNVGKSSLLNALAGYERMIVTELPGTTRDTVEERITLGGLAVRLLDTAGIRASDDRLEQLGVDRSRQAAAQAELALLLFDGASPLTEADLDAISAAKAAPRTLAVVNKCDLPQQLDRAALPFDRLLCVSAKTGEGLDALCAAICAPFADALPCDGGILTNTRQQEAVTRAAKALDTALDALDGGLTPDAVLTDVEAALQAVGELTGRSVREDITEGIFSRFCVGK